MSVIYLENLFSKRHFRYSTTKRGPVTWAVASHAGQSWTSDSDQLWWPTIDTSSLYYTDTLPHLSMSLICLYSIPFVFEVHFGWSRSLWVLHPAKRFIKKLDSHMMEVKPACRSYGSLWVEDYSLQCLFCRLNSSTPIWNIDIDETFERNEIGCITSGMRQYHPKFAFVCLFS